MTCSLETNRSIRAIKARYALQGLQKEKFSKKAYEETTVLARDVDHVLKAPQWQLSPQYPILPDDVLQKHLFPYLDKKELRTCLAICKQFQVIALPFLISHISQDFKWVEDKIDSQLRMVKQSNSQLGRIYYAVNSVRRVRAMDIKDLEAASKKIVSFKAYCIFLVQHPRNPSLSGVQDLMRAILQLEKACRAYTKAFQFLWFE